MSPSFSEGDASLEIDDLSVHIRGRSILKQVSLRLPPRGVTWIIGPVASGKSTLLRAVSGIFRDQAGIVIEGNVRFDGASSHGALVGQRVEVLLASPLEAVLQGIPRRDQVPVAHAQELARIALMEADLEALIQDERPVAEMALDVTRRIAIARAAMSEPSVLFIDEPTSALDDEARGRVLHYLAKLALRTCLVVVTHDQRDLRDLPGHVALLAGGAILEEGDTESFLAQPRTREGQSFIRSGGTDTPSPNASPIDLGNGPLPAPWVKWVIPELLGGTPRPGLLRDLEYELKVLNRLGTSVLVCLEEVIPYDENLVRAYGLSLIHWPLRDMEPASSNSLGEISSVLNQHIDRGAVVIVHCKAGLGRTGMVLASTLLRRGASASDAIQTIRKVEPRFIQTDHQEAALHRLEEELTNQIGTLG